MSPSIEAIPGSIVKGGRMKTIPLTEAQQRLVDLVHQLSPGDVVLLTENDEPVAQIVPWPVLRRRPPRPRPPVTGTPRLGQYQGRLVVPPDFDQPLDEFREYME
jgi:antitoxin (DNA-binding transcriptional repressor) of toxin-antitoxin stability system